MEEIFEEKEWIFLEPVVETMLTYQWPCHQWTMLIDLNTLEEVCVPDGGDLGGADLVEVLGALLQLVQLLLELQLLLQVPVDLRLLLHTHHTHIRWREIIYCIKNNISSLWNIKLSWLSIFRALAQVWNYKWYNIEFQTKWVNKPFFWADLSFLMHNCEDFSGISSFLTQSEKMETSKGLK